MGRLKVKTDSGFVFAGANGAPGNDGKDGVSPTVTVTAITGGHRVTITDATGTKTFDVMDGEGGSGASIALDTSLSKAGYAADAGAVGAAIEQAMQEAGQALDMIMGAIPTETTVYAWIDDYLSEALGGDY